MGDHAIILVADDDPDFNYLVKRAIAKAEIAASARFVHDGQAALDYLEGKQNYVNRDVFPPAAYGVPRYRHAVQDGSGRA